MSNSHDHDAHHDDHGHGISHVASAKNLLGTWGALMVLTVLTVLATKVDFGSSTNLALAMLVALVKATLVCLFFMHLRYDKLFHSVLLVGGILTAALFVGYTLMDSSQYQPSIHWDVSAPMPSPLGPAIKANPAP
jgi:cytochrome c oxidase subunit 4